jgi:hypothetical protein
MAHPHQPSPKGFSAAGAHAHAHASAENEYLVTPPGSGHEHTDANVWIIVKFGLWLVISAILIHIGLGFLFGLWVKQSEEPVAQFPLATGQEQRLPAAPRLQQFPENEFYDFRRREDAVLKEYGWVNKEAGVVRMPIDEAMRLTVERGLPVRAQQPTNTPQPADSAQPTPTEQTPTVAAPTSEVAPRETPGMMPADSSAGRTMERRRQ